MSRHCRSDVPAQDRPPFPITLFVADTGEVAETNATTASPMPAISLPILVSSGEALSDRGILGKFWHPPWDGASPPLAFRELGPTGGTDCADGCAGGCAGGRHSKDGDAAVSAHHAVRGRKLSLRV